MYLAVAALAVGYAEVVCCTISGKILRTLATLTNTVTRIDALKVTSSTFTALSGRNQANRVRAAFLENILKQDLSWHDTGELFLGAQHWFAASVPHPTSTLARVHLHLLQMAPLEKSSR